jgi:hypothetical protein
MIRLIGEKSQFRQQCPVLVVVGVTVFTPTYQELPLADVREFLHNIEMSVKRDHPEPDAADVDFFRQLRREVERQISEYVYQVPRGAIGTPLPADEIRADLKLMRLCLVEPRWEEVDICNTPQEAKTGMGNRRKCVTMAEDKGYVLVFDQVGNEYYLAWRGERGLGTWGIRGDAVGCFIAR